MRIGICDDQREIRELIASKIKSLYPDESMVCYETGVEMFDESYLPDILFLDIKMPGMNGIETARELRRKDERLIIIFVTAVEDYVFQAFDVKAFHYLLKPFTDEKFAEVLQNAVRQIEGRKELESVNVKKEVTSLIVKTKGEHITVDLKDIIYAEVFNRKVILHTVDTDIEYYGKMKELEKKVGDHFYRPHRAYLVNFRHVKRYNATTIWMVRGQALIAKQNYREFVKSYLRYHQKRGSE
ncbi:MAG: response regulator transcription factor [Lachnospiraceae bacterium]|nr:response regulator transcription factor [Lachnospiraceae bacterium]